LRENRLKALSKRYLRGWHAVLVCLLTLAGLTVPALRNHAQGPTSYTITDLGTLGGAQSKAFGINNCGSVVGGAFTTANATPNPFFRSHGQATLTDIGNLGFDGTATAINASNFVVGNSGTNAGLRGFIWRDNNGNGISDVGELVDLGTLPGDTDVFAGDINDAGRVVGSAEATLVPRAFVWQQGVMQEIAAVNGIDPTTANGLNNPGQIVGAAFVSASSQTHAFFLDGSVMIDLKTLGGNFSDARDLNDTGYVVGWSYVDPNPTSPRRAFIWRDANSNGLSDAGEMKDLGTLSGDAHSEAFDINATGYVVGASYTAAGVSRAAIWHDDNNDGDSDPGEMKDLNTLISPVDATWTNLREARSINDGGQIVGFGTKSNGEVHAFLLTPTGFTPPSCPTPPPSPTPTPSPTVTVAVAPLSVTEDGGTNLVYTFTRTGSTASALTVNFSVSETATLGVDYSQTGAASFTSTSGTVTFGAGNSTATITLDPTTDTTVEGDETVLLMITAGSYIIGSPGAATGTITNDDTVVSVSVSPASVTEDGATNLDYTFMRTGVTSGALTVNFSVAGTAGFSTDYAQTGAASFTSTSGTVSFGAGASTATITINPTTDSSVEPDETVLLTITAGSYIIGSPGAATGTIANDDTEVSVAVSPLSVSEDGSTNLDYTFTRTGVTSGALTVNFSVAGTAGFSTDYAQTGAASFGSTSGTVSFGAGASAATVTINPTTDSSIEPDETVLLTITAGSYTIGSSPNNSASGTITNDDTEVSVAVSPASVTEDGGTNLVYTFTRTGVTSGALIVGFSVSETATFGTDYSQTGATSFGSTSGTVTFGAGNSTATITLDPATDPTVEPDETVLLTITAGSYNVGSPSAATGTITNDDTTVSVSVAPASVTEDGTTNLVYTFARTGVTSGALTVNYSVTGTASLGTDYAGVASASGSVSFTGIETSKTVTIDPTPDTVSEPDETVILTVTSGTGYTLGSPNSATGTITNDDGTPSISINNVTLSEGNSGTTSFVFTVSLSTAAAAQVTVDYATAAGSINPATGGTNCGTGTDFENKSGPLTFAAGETSKTVSISVCGDTGVEPDETFLVNLSNNSANSTIANAQGTGTIANDDTDVNISVSPSTVTEDGAANLIYTFTRTGVTSGPLTVNFSFGGTATLNTDYTSSSVGTIAFGAGNSTATVTIDPNADATDEAIKTVILTVTSGAGYNVGSTPAATGSITVTAPTLVMEDGVNALAIDSVTFVRAPFRVIGDLNFSTDRRTRIMIFTSDLGLTQPDSQKLTVQAMGFDLPVQAVGPLNGAPGFSYIIVKLPDNLITGNLPLTVTLYGVSSNSALLNIVP